MPSNRSDRQAETQSRWSRVHRLLYWLPAIVFLPWMADFIYLKGALYSDLTISHYPNLLYLHRALAEFRALPLWSPAILGGFPFYANPLNGLWYPPGWPAVVWPEPWVFNLLAAAHLVLGAIGMGRLLADMGMRPGGQLLGGLAFGMMPKLLAHYGAGHITLVYAVSWTPWLLMVSRRSWSGWSRPGAVLAVIFYADPRWAAYAGVLWLGWSAAHRRKDRAAGRFLKKIGLEIALALLLAAPLLLPMLAYSARSTRAALTPAEVLVFSLPPVRLLGLFTPAAAGTAEWTLYPGAVILAGSLLAVAAPRVRKKMRFWIWVAAAALLFAMGNEIPVLRLWANLPGALLLRVPARALFLFGMALIVMAAAALDGLISTRRDGGESRSVYRALTALAAVWLAILAAGLWLDDPAGAAFIWSAGLGLASVAAYLLAANPALTPPLRVGLILLVGMVDWSAAAFGLLEPRSKADVFAAGAEAAAWLAAQPGDFRVYSPSYSIPQHTAALHGLNMASGIDPLQLQTAASFMAAASGIPQGGYSIPLPPLDGENAGANASAALDAGLLGMLNVEYIVAEFEIQSGALEEVVSFGETRIYRNLLNRGPFWVERPGGDLEAAGTQSSSWNWAPNRIEIEVSGPGVLVLSEMAYPGWQASAGRRLAAAEGLFRTVELPAETKRVSFRFQPVDLYAGLALFAAGAGLWLQTSRQRHG